MIKFRLLTFCLATALLLHGCSRVLESVVLSSVSKDFKEINNQEAFDINIKSLTFESAQQANNTPYSRQLMQTGIGKNANVFDEADYLNPKIPASIPAQNYLLGAGDELTFLQLNEFANLTSNFPIQKEVSDYLIGVGDELTFIQISEGMNTLPGEVAELKSTENILKTSGVVSTNGNILLLGLGSIQAKNRTLDAMQTEVRNILIRNGQTPNFQLDITGFKSKKAFVTMRNQQNSFSKSVIPITNLPKTLKEVVLNYGIQSSKRETFIIKLVRNGQKFRMTAGQILNNPSTHVFIEDRDEVEIFQEKSINSSKNIIVGSNGNILLQDIGRLKAENRSLEELRADINRILLEKGMVPNFQLEISGYNSKKFFLVRQGLPGKILKLTNSKLTLKEAVLGNPSNIKFNNEFIIVNLIRDGITYQMTFKELLNGQGSKVLIQNGDTVELKSFKYKPGQVFALSGAANAQMIAIDPSIRETLADVLFNPNGALNSLAAKRSEIYLLRGRNPSVAYHLDAQNVSRILVAAKTELRPNDIIYAADRPIISFTRTLSEISPLRSLFKDIIDGNIP